MAYTDTRVSDRFFASENVGETRMTLIKKSYAYLALGVLSGIAGAALAVNFPPLLKLFSGWGGWIIAMLLLNGIPMVAMACRHNPVVGTLMLILDGFVAGLVLGPMVFMAGFMASRATSGGGLTEGAVQQSYVMVWQALGLTGLVFLGVSLAVWTSGRHYSAPKGLFVGIFMAIIGAVVLSFFVHSGILGVIIAAAIGILGVLALVYGTADVLYGRVDSPIAGALILFSGLFNVFTAILWLLMQFNRRD